MKLPHHTACCATSDTRLVFCTHTSVNWNKYNEHFNYMSMQNTSAGEMKRLSEEWDKRGSLSDSSTHPAFIIAAVETASQGSSLEIPIVATPYYNRKPLLWQIEILIKCGARQSSCGASLKLAKSPGLVFISHNSNWFQCGYAKSMCNSRLVLLKVRAYPL